jgi:hypothetical protein
MLKRLVAVILVLFVTSISVTGKKKPDADPIMPDITARGRALFEYDQAAWHATDAVQAVHPPAQAVGRYIARKSDIGWQVAFGHLNDARDKFLVAYEATQGATLQDFSVKKLDPPQEDTSFYLAAAKAIDTALRDFQGQKHPYNVAILPAPPNQLYVYVVPAQTENGVYPLGGDARYLISSDGNSIVEKRQLHKSIIENRGDLPKGATPAAGYHTHVLSDVPEDTDVFYVLTRQPSVPEYIGTMKKKLFIIGTDGTIREGKM